VEAYDLLLVATDEARRRIARNDEWVAAEREKDRPARFTNGGGI
jgi:hypothetical protein